MSGVYLDVSLCKVTTAADARRTNVLFLRLLRVAGDAALLSLYSLYTTHYTTPIFNSVKKNLFSF